MKSAEPWDCVEVLDEVTARVDIAELATHANERENLRSQLRRAHAREDALRKILGEERKIAIQLRGVIAAKDRQIEQHEAINTDLLEQLGRTR